MNGIGAVPARSSSWGFRVLTKLRERHPIWHAVAWVGVYVALVMVGGTLAGVPDAANPVTAAMVLGLSAALILYVAGIGRMHYYGLRPPGGRGDVARSLLFLPLAVIVLLQFTKGLRADLDVTSVLLVIGLMVGVGFVEELLFRGFLYRAILENGTLTRAVIISGLTFGIGHAVNLARGYTSLEQLSRSRLRLPSASCWRCSWP